jgi:hypothetical protein
VKPGSAPIEGIRRDRSAHQKTEEWAERGCQRTAAFVGACEQDHTEKHRKYTPDGLDDKTTANAPKQRVANFPDMRA